MKHLLSFLNLVVILDRYTKKNKFLPIQILKFCLIITKYLHLYKIIKSNCITQCKALNYNYLFFITVFVHFDKILIYINLNLP